VSSGCTTTQALISGAVPCACGASAGSPAPAPAAEAAALRDISVADEGHGAAGGGMAVFMVVLPSTCTMSRRGRPSVAAIGHHLDGRAHAVVGAAAADVGHRRVDVGVGRARLVLQQRRGGHDHAALAVAALRHVQRAQAFCTGWLPSGDRPSMVVIFWLGRSADTGSTQLRTVGRRRCARCRRRTGRCRSRTWCRSGRAARAAPTAAGCRLRYGTSKAALIHLTRQQAVELGDIGIRVNAVAPGPVETAMAQAVHTPAIRADYRATIPLGRYGSLQEIAAVVHFLCTPAAGYINGQVLAVDGGFDAAGVGLPTLRETRAQEPRR
jgi:NAD(P)-dependent dehydrogenase (short-subunit alcohol dehydrogenase family)